MSRAVLVAGAMAFMTGVLLFSFWLIRLMLRAARLPWPLRGFDPWTEYGTLEEMIVHGLTSSVRWW